MPKLKTRKAVRKRFKISKSGKAFRTRALRRHLLTDRPKGKKRRARRYKQVDKTDEKRVKKLLPYG